MQKYRNIILLAVAVILSILAAYSVSKYMDHKEKEIVAAIEEKNNYKQILVPNANLEVGDLISTATVSLRPVPAEYVPDGALTSDDFDNVAGMTVKSPITQGKAIVRSQLQGLSAVEKFSELLKPGERAISLKVSALDSNENMLVPGDFFDLLLLKEGGNKETEVNVVLENVQALATGTATVADYVGQGYDGYASVTIGVKTEDYAKVLLSKEKGSFVYALKRSDDSARPKYEAKNGIDASSSGISVFSAGKSKDGVLIETLTLLSPDSQPDQKQKDRKFVKYSEGSE